MRILMLSQFYPPIVGGIEQHVRNLSTALVARGHQVAVATLWQEGLSEVETDQGVRIYRLRGALQRAGWLYHEKRRRHAPPFPDPQLTAGLARVIALERPAVVHGHNWLVRSFLPLKAWSRTRLVVTLHDFSLVCAKHRFLYRGVACTGPGIRCFQCAAAHYGLPRSGPIVLANWAMGMAERAVVDMFLPVSQAIAAGTGLAASSLPYQVVPNFVPDDVANVENINGSDDARLPGGEFLLCVGDISPDKGAQVLLQAHAGLSHPVPLVLIGRRSDAISTDLGKNVYLLPSMPHDAVMHAWTKSMIGLAPSIVPDACPTVVMEAMATGKPVIGSRIGGLTDLVSHDETGLLVPPGDANALRQAMERLIGDSELRSHMGHVAQQRVGRFQASQVVPRVEQVYEQVLAGSHQMAAAPSA